MNNRAISLDALRGYAIITMVLSGTVAAAVLPGWMSHAQIPPPECVFNPAVYGITWVDLVFPFFLFAMGAAFPFSLGRKIEQGVSKWRLVGDSLLRGVKLTFFAIFIQHIYPFVVSSPADATSWLIALGGFALMFGMFMRLPDRVPQWGRVAVEIASYAIGITMMLTINYAGGREFSLGYSNIIILVLANMAIFGSIIYIFTSKNRWWRIAVLPFVMGIFLSSATDGSWAREVMNFSPVPWMYKFYYLKYLFIIIPGSIAGEYLRAWVSNRTEASVAGEKREKWLPLILTLSIAVIVMNLYGLYMRYLVVNLVATIAILGALYYFLRERTVNKDFWRQLFVAGAFLLLLGLTFEGFEGGIRKDHSTYSYYFTASGLAFFALMAFSIMCDVYRLKWLSNPLQMAGQNPMIAYVASQLVVMPILGLAHLSGYLNMLSVNAPLGFLRGVIVTTLALIVAIIFTKLKWFWRT